MIGDKSDNTEEQNLLDRKKSSSDTPVIIKMSNDDCTKENLMLSQPAPQDSKGNGLLLESFQKHLRSSLKAINASQETMSSRKRSIHDFQMKKRLILKHGDCNVVQGDVAKRRKRYMQDIFSTLIDARWRWIFLVFALHFLMSWSLFAIVWWVIAILHGDIAYLQKQEEMKEAGIDIEQQAINDTFTMCVTDISSLASAFLFSVEMQHTIGYGNRFVTEECFEAVFFLSFQSIVGVFIQAFMVGMFFAKLSRPKKRAQTLLFSKNAVICHRVGVPCLMIRVGDMRKSHIIEAHVRVYFVKRRITKEGEELPFFQQELNVGADGGQDRLMFIWPTTIVHKIEKNTPLYGLSAQDLLKERFEIVVTLEGVIESTGMITQARSSYLPSEILWGHRFDHVVTFNKEAAEYEVDYKIFNNSHEVETPLCSAKQLDDVRTKVKARNAYENEISDVSTESGSNIQNDYNIELRKQTKTNCSPAVKNSPHVIKSTKVNIPKEKCKECMKNDDSTSLRKDSR